MIINGENLILGRVASFAAKNALLGESIVIVNCDKVIMTGSKKQILDRFVQKLQMGRPTKGPFFSRGSDRIVLRAIRNMLPYKQEKGKLALKKVKCHKGVPGNVKIEEAVSIKSAHVEKVPNLKYITLERVSNLIGGVK